MNHDHMMDNMDHSNMDHSNMDHGNMGHPKMDHSDHMQRDPDVVLDFPGTG